MNSVVANDLAKIVLQKNSLQDCSLDELQQISNRYPYFATAQLLLTKKLNEENSDQYNAQLQKLLLYIQPSVWLEQLLEPKAEMIVHNSQKNIEPVTEVVQPTEGSSAAAIEPIVEQNTDAPKIETPELKTEPVVAIPEFTFEPYHTVDYFASQGIKIRDEEIPKDKLGKQMKSFTEWLKTLKRLPATEISAAPVSGSERKVEQMAENSISNPQVVTEAMAEVWVKQGNNEKAIATYNKLSLLDPSKSSYFAAKIELLKTT